jgi:uncharacterized alpha-E superfamily protein
MLSRVANGLYWMSRYIERAENTTRLVDVNLQLLLNFRNLNDSTLAGHWMPIVQSTGEEEKFAELYPKATGENVSEFFVFQDANPNSIVSCIYLARENARSVRDQITTEFWSELNRIYLFLRSPGARALWDQSPHDFFLEVRNSSLLLQGLADATIVRNEGWHFMVAGRHIERADKISRMLDVRQASMPETGVPKLANQADALGWSAMLRSCSAWDAYKALHGSEVQPALVAKFLLLSEDFPRSVRFCVEQLNRALRRISGVSEGHFCNSAEKHAGRLLAELQFCDPAEIFETGLHHYIDQIQAKLDTISDDIFQAYIFQPFQPDSDNELQQQEEQQQQIR